MSNHQLVWLRNDLRLHDNPALYHASLQGEIEVVYVATPLQWQEHNESGAKLGLRAALLKQLQGELAALGIPLTIIHTDKFTDVPAKLLEHSQNHKIQGLWFNRETPLHERQRDAAVKEALQAYGVAVHECVSDLIVDTPVLSQQGTPFKVFTPFYKRWLSLLIDQDSTPLNAPKVQGEVLSAHPPECAWAGEYRHDLWPAESDVIKQKLWHFCHHKEQDYDLKRDIPSVAGTSTLSPYLALGALGPRECVNAIQYNCEVSGRDWRDSIWLKELAWRDFYRQLLLHFDRLNMNKPFKPETQWVQWNPIDTTYQAWCEGKTGFPIVDAAMRQLIQTGWMHNRLRMITASFFTKLLLLDWRAGERFFMTHLIDGEFAANNGGWQWSASTGCDAAPYFRVFNPTRQSERFDPQGDFIRRMVPELASLDAKSIHNPSDKLRAEVGYPAPIIDYKKARIEAISAFENLK